MAAISTYENSDASSAATDDQDKQKDLLKTMTSQEPIVEPTNQNKASKWKIFDRFLWKNHTLREEDATFSDRIKYSLLCPPHGSLATIITWSVLIITIWATSYVVLGEISLPGTQSLTVNVEIRRGTVFAILVLLVFAHLGGILVSKIKMPPLLGMLIVGILLKNVPYVAAVGQAIDPNWSSALRNIALTVILLRAGLGLDPDALRKLSGMVFRLAFTPCLVEASVSAAAAHLMLGFPVQWGFMLGFVLAAVSPAVVVPCLLSLQEGGYGVAKGIPTLVIAAASVDDVLAISAFTILLGITFAGSDNTNIVELVFKGPKEAVIGILWGVGWGLLLILFPPAVPHPEKDRRIRPNSGVRTLLTLGGGILALFGSNKADLPGAGALAVLSMGFIAGLGWRKQGWSDDNPVSRHLASMWKIFQPLLFGLIGTEIQVSELDGKTVGLGIGVLICGLSVRIVVSYLAVLGGDLNNKERMFVSMAWLPKATVQAAVGPLALDLANKALSSAKLDSDTEVLEYQVRLGQQVLAIAVLAILITAPIGAVAVMTAGPKLLVKNGGEYRPANSEQQIEKGEEQETVIDKTL